MATRNAPITLRFARREDVGLVLEFIRELASYEGLLQEVVATEALLEEHLFGSRRAAEVLLAEVGGEPAAFALFFPNFSTFRGRPGLYLEDLYVRPQYRGHGLGLQLMRALAHLALQRGCARFEWWVLDWNAPAIAFYRSLGAVGMQDWTVQRLDGEALQKLAAAFDPAALPRD